MISYPTPDTWTKAPNNVTEIPAALASCGYTVGLSVVQRGMCREKRGKLAQSSTRPYRRIKAHRRKDGWRCRSSD